MELLNKIIYIFLIRKENFLAVLKSTMASIKKNAC